MQMDDEAGLVRHGRRRIEPAGELLAPGLHALLAPEDGAAIAAFGDGGSEHDGGD